MRKKLETLLEADAAEQPTGAALDALRDKIKQVLDLDERIRDAEDALAHLKMERWNIVGHFGISGELVGLMQSTGVPELTIEARGNHPAYVAKLRSMVTAKLPDDERREEAFKRIRWLRGLAKTQFKIDFARDQQSEAKRFQSLLNENNVRDYDVKFGVHSGTLTAEIRRRVSDGCPPSPAEMDLLGAAVYPTVELTEKKELRTDVKKARTSRG